MDQQQAYGLKKWIDLYIDWRINSIIKSMDICDLLYGKGTVKSDVIFDFI